jgi:iron complex transport system permease protein
VAAKAGAGSSSGFWSAPSPRSSAGSALFGAAFLVWCDALARSIMAPLELPVGVITALIGGPFFLWLLVKKR